MKCLYSVVATKDSNQRWLRSLSFQEKIQEGLFGWDKLLVTDKEKSADIPKEWNVVQSNLFEHGKFNYSRYRNVAMAYAEEKHYDYLIQSNADMFMLSPPRTFAESGISYLMTYHTEPGEDVDGVLMKYKNGIALKYIGATAFIMERKIFSRFKFYEGYYGYGFDDIDFIGNVIAPAGVVLQDGTPFGARAIHIYDSGNLWGPSQQEDANRNKELWSQRWNEIRKDK